MVDPHAMSAWQCWAAYCSLFATSYPRWTIRLIRWNQSGSARLCEVGCSVATTLGVVNLSWGDYWSDMMASLLASSLPIKPVEPDCPDLLLCGMFQESLKEDDSVEPTYSIESVTLTDYKRGVFTPHTIQHVVSGQVSIDSVLGFHLDASLETCEFALGSARILSSRSSQRVVQFCLTPFWGELCCHLTAQSSMRLSDFGNAKDEFPPFAHPLEYEAG
ncbi:hypothetical protein CIHG_04421 [Coccidioides immitis H538.4]|uniref:Uncharacterized protein n=3 Tax=Coccidioides immitis TaxID=5501 RepID=A0A0J8R4R4_COCIT|nr:hypothetical protein CIRG_09354 [Coccidioides immitis RMSCC 2394]KMU80074.1 hypothetical protein CISG_08416 [Coccidioides immitis RMSCC 3703]KMU86633.1 hypothetical protein CIHG_04421 [Coccidioides immitis H538.4]